IPLALGLAAHAYWDRLFFPDSRYYLVMTYRDMGYDAASALAAQQKVTGLPAAPWYFAATDPVWRMVQPRMLYPLLSVPFVWATGPRLGMMAVPALSSLVTVAACARLTQRLYGPVAALIAAGALAASITVTDIAVALTDPLAMALIALMLLNLPIRRRIQGRNLVWLGVLSATLCLTRQTSPVVLGLMGAGSVWALLPARRGQPGQRRDWLLAAAVISAITVSGQIVGTLLAPYDVSVEFLLASHQRSMSAALAHLPAMAWQITKAEAGMMARTDVPLTMLAVAAALYVVTTAREIDAWLLAGGSLGTYALMLANGFPSFLRYECVLFPLVAVCAGGLLRRWLPEPLRWVPPQPGPSTDRPGPRWWVPFLTTASVAACASGIAWSATHGSASLVGAVPTAPAAAAALPGTPGSAVPVKTVSAQKVLREALDRAVLAYRDHDVQGLIRYLDWRHPLRYDPAGAGDPGWSTRAADGSAVIRYGDFVEMAPVEVAAGLSRSGRYVPQSLKVTTRRVDGYGEDVTFTIADRSGQVHRGRATVLYPTRASSPGTITELVYEP
ncbi:MAG: hypothetical protein ACJ786_22200, partial [Catenulispora sp.]